MSHPKWAQENNRKLSTIVPSFPSHVYSNKAAAMVKMSAKPEKKGMLKAGFWAAVIVRVNSLLPLVCSVRTEAAVRRL